jgi:hypothetical protein
MAKVVFCGFGPNDGLYNAKVGEVLLRVAVAAGVSIPKKEDAYVIEIQEMSDELQTTYMEDLEIEKLIGLGLLDEAKAYELQQYTIGSKFRLADQCLIKGDILVKPYKG